MTRPSIVLIYIKYAVPCANDKMRVTAQNDGGGDELGQR